MTSNRRGFIGSLLALLVMPWLPKAAKAAPVERVVDSQTGIALRFVKQFDCAVPWRPKRMPWEQIDARLLAEWEQDRKFLDGNQWPASVREARRASEK